MMNNEMLLDALTKFGEAVQMTTGNKEFVILLACKTEEGVVHTYEMGEDVTPKKFCLMAVELMVGCYGTQQGWRPPEGSRPTNPEENE